MKPNEIVNRAKKLQEKTRRRKRDRRYLKVVGFLKAKGLLFDENIEPQANVKVDIKDLLWVAEKIEPRVFEVFPAAFLHFPKTFFNTNVIPNDLLEIIKAIKAKTPIVREFRGIEFKKMNQWANRKLNDRRVKPIVEKKIPRNYRFRPEVITVLQKHAHDANLTETECLEQMILKTQ